MLTKHSLEMNSGKAPLHNFPRAYVQTRSYYLSSNLNMNHMRIICPSDSRARKQTNCSLLSALFVCYSCLRLLAYVGISFTCMRHDVIATVSSSALAYTLHDERFCYVGCCVRWRSPPRVVSRQL